MIEAKEMFHKSALASRAYAFAKQAHKVQKRKTGEPFVSHPLAVAKMAAELGFDEATVVLALLHDVIKEGHGDASRLRREFGDDIADRVLRLTKVGSVKYHGTELHVENIRKFVLYLSRDARTLIVKLLSRLHNLKTLYVLPPATQKRVALETMEIYAPLAYQLGLYKISSELEDLAFPYIYPEEHKSLLAMVKDRYEERERYIERLKPIVEETLRAYGVPVIRMNSRAKHYFSLYRKLLRYDMQIDRIHDLVAFRIIVPSVSDCYNALGVIHSVWPPLPGRLKDYIASPKPNGYRSIHTTVETPEEKITEIQIRTDLMDYEAEFGIAAHFAYREAKGTKAYRDRRTVKASVEEAAWLEQMREWEKNFTDIDFFKTRILTLTPKGDVISLPVGATPVDFAYHVHSAVGNRCTHAEINGAVMPLETPLQTGDVVRIVTQKNKTPSPSWLRFVRTATARQQIKAALRLSHAVRIEEKTPIKTQFTLAASEAKGVLREITELFKRMRVKVQAFRVVPAQGKSRGWQVTIECRALPERVVEKLLHEFNRVPAVLKAVARQR